MMDVMSVISTRTSVISDTSGMFAFDTYECDDDTHECDFHTHNNSCDSYNEPTKINVRSPKNPDWVLNSSYTQARIHGGGGYSR
jgi:hypothetical protein